MDVDFHKRDLNLQGFTIIDSIFTEKEVEAIKTFIENAFPSGKKSTDLFAIRKLLIVLPGIKEKIFNNSMLSIVNTVFGKGYFIVKGLYFDKPSFSNWFVTWHQDLSVSVCNKTDSPQYKGWTIKDHQFGVQPPLHILENICTIRIHLDDCTAQNGALHVIPGSHKEGIHQQAENKGIKQDAVICEVPKGAVMLMKPLLLHSSHKSTAAVNRRVLHIEFCNTELPESIQWAEKECIN